MDHALNIWGRITDEIKAQVNEASLNLFMNSIQPRGIEGETLFLEAINEICKDWNERRYRGLIQKILQESTPPLHCVFVTRLSKNKFEKPQQLGLPTISDSEEKKVLPVPEKPRPTSKGELMFNGKYTFDTFVVGKSNQFAHAICQAVAKNLGTMYNPVFIYGGVGLGKTHLIHAIGNAVLSKSPEKKVIYLSTEHFTVEFVDSIQNDRITEFSNFYKSMDILIIDDIQFLIGKEKTQDLFFHIFNTLHQSGKQIVLSSDKPPKDLKGLNERLVSRFQWGLTADIQPPDYETRIAILKNKSLSYGIDLSQEIVEYIAMNITSNIRELEGCLIKILASSSLNSKEIDMNLAKKIVKEVSTSREVTVSIDYITKIVCNYYNVEENKVREKNRRKEVVMARQLAMFLSKQLTKSSLKTIGLHFGGRDHSTVIHAYNSIEDQISSDATMKETVENLKSKIELGTS